MWYLISLVLYVRLGFVGDGFTCFYTVLGLVLMAAWGWGCVCVWILIFGVLANRSFCAREAEWRGGV